MTPAELRAARATLGQMWGLNRHLKMAELGRVLRLQGRDPGASVRDWERGHTPISGPVSLVIEAYLSGWYSDCLCDWLKSPRRRPNRRSFSPPILPPPSA